MNFAKVWSITKAVLYELQPFRILDVISLFKYILNICRLLTKVGLLSDKLYKRAVEWPATVSALTWTKVTVWATGWALMTYAGFGSLWILLSMIASIFMNLGTRKKGEMSAYSVFNKGFRELLGTLNADQFDNEIRHRGEHGHRMRDIVQLDDLFEEDGDEGEEERGRRAEANRAEGRGRRRGGGGANNAAGGDGGDIGAARDRPAAENGGAGAAVRGAAAGGGARKKGKKARRNYEERLQRREAAQQIAQEQEGVEVDSDGWERFDPAELGMEVEED